MKGSVCYDQLPIGVYVMDLILLFILWSVYVCVVSFVVTLSFDLCCVSVGKKKERVKSERS